jgi:NADH:ubiquinone oxidoreductase subunit D
MQEQIAYLIAIVLLVGIAIVSLARCLRTATHQLSRMNEQLMVMAGVGVGGEATGRAMVANTREMNRALEQAPPAPEPAKPSYSEVVGGI